MLVICNELTGSSLEDSFGGVPEVARELLRELRDKGCICVIAAGDEAVDLDEDLLFKSSQTNRSRSLFVTIANEEEFRANMIMVARLMQLENCARFQTMASKLYAWLLLAST